MKVIITGATGMVGKGVLLECLDHPEVTAVLVIGRNSLQMDHPKLKELIHKDFSEFESISEHLQGYDACYCCMGVSAAGLSEDQYHTFTYDYTLSLVNALYHLNREMSICYVSGEGTDSSESGRMMWARVKGKTENAILDMGFKQAYMFRPGIIIPLRGIKSGTKLYQFFYDYFMWAIKLFKRLRPKAVINTTQIGLAMINVSLRSFDKKILRPAEIIEASQA